MQQILFTIPLFKESFPPDGIPIPGFGAMLFICFLVVVLWGSRRAKRTANMPPERFQDMVIWLFVAGLIGARILYMVQYSRQYPETSFVGLLGAFIKIWEGGIIFYGSVLGGVLGYALFYWLVVRRLRVNGWQLADAVAPLLALGLAFGRFGCYLNGCCWGQVACEECQTVPIGASHFPLLPAHARKQLVRDEYLQTTTGFTIAEQSPFSPLLEDPRTRVDAVEAGSPAEKAGVKPGDLIVKVNGEPNSIMMDLSGTQEQLTEAEEILKQHNITVQTRADGRIRYVIDELPTYLEARMALRALPGVYVSATDRLVDSIRDWPRGKNRLSLSVERGEDQQEVVDLPPFVPITIGLYPTQLYEIVSMLLIMLVLLAYYPFRRHDGQLMVMLMMLYAIHRFVNESLRIEPTIGLGLTLSQWGSVVIFAAGLAIEAYLWRTVPSRWKGTAEPQAAVPATAK